MDASIPNPPEGVPLAAWLRIAKPADDRWVIAERDAQGEVIGTSHRFPDGGKGFAPGGRRGLVIPWPLGTYAGSTASSPVYVCEGASDTAAMLGLGLDAVGVPMAGRGGEELAGLLEGRHAVCVADADQAGRNGMQKVAGSLASRCPSVRTIEPPLGCKDAREAVIAGATRAAFEAAASAAAPFRPPAFILGERDGDPVMLCMADVVAREVVWLWKDRIPMGRISLLAGQPGCGKSFISTDIAARVTRGAAFPDGAPCPAGSVLMIAGEDDPADTIRPRLDAHEADAGKVQLLTATVKFDAKGCKREAAFTLADLPALERALEAMDAPALCVIDPIGSFLGAKLDAYRDNEVRGVLAPLAKLAERFGVAILLVAHHGKAVGRRADGLVLGSTAFTGIARSVLHLLPDPQDDSRRLLLPGKSNLGAKAAGLAMRIEGDPPKVAWQPDPVGMTAEQVLAAGSGRSAGSGQLEEAKDWLRDVLSGGPVPARDITKKAEEDGLKWRTVERAKEELKVNSAREGYSEAGRWMWGARHCPPTDPNTAKHVSVAVNEGLGGVCDGNVAMGQHTA